MCSEDWDYFTWPVLQERCLTFNCNIQLESKNPNWTETDIVNSANIQWCLRINLRSVKITGTRTPHTVQGTKDAANQGWKQKPPSATDDVQNTLQNSCICDSESVESSKLACADHNISSRPRFDTKATEKVTDTYFAFPAHNLWLNSTLHENCLALPNSVKPRERREKVSQTAENEILKLHT